MTPSKLFKVMYKAKKIAIVAASFDEFLDKSSKKLDLSAEVEIGVYSADGFKIDEESFVLLKEETVLIISVGTENEMIGEAADPAISSPLKNNTTESPPKNNTTESPPKNNTTESPPKKRSKKDMFIEKVKDCENIKEIVGEASYIIGHLEDQNESFKMKLKMAKAELHLRPYIEVLQRKVTPTWLLNSQFDSPLTRWALPIYFELTQSAKILLDRLKEADYSRKITLDEIIEACETMIVVYDVSSETVQHNKQPKRVQLTVEEWDEIFDKLKIDDSDKRQRFRELIQPITKEERNKISQFCQWDKWVLHVKYLNINPKVDGLKVTEDSIRKWSERYEKYLTRLYFPTNNKDYTNEVFILVEGLQTQEVKNGLKAELEKFVMPGKEIGYWYHQDQYL